VIVNIKKCGKDGGFLNVIALTLAIYLRFTTM